MRTPFLGSAYTSRSLDLATQRAINIYPEIVETKEGKDVGAFFGTPGLDLLATLGAGPVRGVSTAPPYMYAVSGNGFYTISPAWVATLVGTLSTSTGPVDFAWNGLQIMAVDGVDGYVWNGHTFTTGVLSAIGVRASSISYQDGFGIVNNLGTTQWFQSNLFDLGTFNALNFSSADAKPDFVVSIFDNKREAWLFGTNSTEVWINAGLPGFAFQRLQGVSLPQGCAAAASPALVGSSIAWLGSDDQGGGIVYLQAGYQATRISTHAIENAIQGYSDISDAIGYSYQQEGHFFYVLTFPTGNATWVYDLTASALAGVPMWHQRAAFSNGAFSRHIGNCACFFNGKNVVGDYQNGNLYAFNLNTYQDNGTPVKRLRSWRAVKGGVGVPMRFNSLELDIQSGVNVPANANPQVMLRWTDDGGHTYGPELQTSLGKTGETSKRVIWNRLGTTKRQTGLDRVWEISHLENIPTAWIGAEMDAEPT